MTADFDRDRLAKLLGLVGSAHDGEALAAARKAHALITAAGMTWGEVIENDALRARVAGEPAPASNWRTIDEPAEQARWALALHATHTIHLTRFEADFLGTVAGWRGPLTPKQQPIFQRILREAGARAGWPPPQ